MWLGGGDFWRAAIKAAMFFDDRLCHCAGLGPDHYPCIEQDDAELMIKLDDFENSFAALPARAGYSRKSQTTPSLWPGRASRIVGMNSASEPSSLYQPETASATGQIAFVDFANICVFWIDHLGAPRFGNLAKQHIGFRRRH